MAIAARPQATVFKLTAPLLSKGRYDQVLARGDLLTTRIKVYAEGGENVMHAHANEEHMFVVLQGQATFHLDSDENAVAVNRYESVLLPKGAYYWFKSSGDENLVMLRVGAFDHSVEDGRMGPDGRPLPGGSAENKHVEGVPIPGQFFGA